MAEKSVSTEIVIQAPAAKVWSILSDLEHYATWNPFIIYAKGSFAEGQKLSVVEKAPGEKPRLFKRVLHKIVEGKEFRWMGRIFLPGLFDSERIFLLESIDESQTRLVHKEIFRGLLVPILWGRLEWSLKAGFNKMNSALKELCEKS